MTHTDLKPCPFCGSKAVQTSIGEHWVCCSICGAYGPPAFDRPHGATLWNARARTPDTAPRKPFCETCGKDVAEVLCPPCAKWWAGNPPPAPSQSGDLIAEAQQCVADGTHEDAWDEDGNPIGWVVEHHAISICKKLITALRAAEAENAELTAFRNGYKDTIRRLQDSVSAAEARETELTKALEIWQRAHETGRSEPCFIAYEHARRALGGEP